MLQSGRRATAADRAEENPATSDEPIVIEDNGNWRWRLIVHDGEVTASKAIKYDGVLTYTTESKHVPRGRNSQANLTPTQVIDRFETHTETSWGALYAEVADALETFGQSIEVPNDV